MIVIKKLSQNYPDIKYKNVLNTNDMNISVSTRTDMGNGIEKQKEKVKIINN